VHYVALKVNGDCTIDIADGFLEVTGVNIVGAVGSQTLASKLVQTSPSFCAVRCIGQTVTTVSETFVFCSPEAASVREKMTFSSAKASALAEMKKVGVLFDRNVEITDTADVDEYLKPEPAEGGASSRAAEITHEKPKPKGRRAGKRVVKKFVADEE